MPSFDVVSEIDKHEFTNAVDQANREIGNRFDFKGTDSRIQRTDHGLSLIAPAAFQIKQIGDILRARLAKRGIDAQCLQEGEIQEANRQARQEIKLREGIDKETARKIVKMIKDTKLKAQAAIQDRQVRVSGKKRDDLQEVIAFLKKQKTGLPLQFTNFRD